MFSGAEKKEMFSWCDETFFSLASKIFFFLATRKFLLLTFSEFSLNFNASLFLTQF